MNNIMNNIKREAKKFWNDEDGMGVVEVVLITIGIFTPYYGMGTRCMA